MIDCKKCYHYEACKSCYELAGYTIGENIKPSHCPIFKDKDLIAELPCKVGDTVYFHKILCDGKGTVVVEKDIVKQFDINKFDTFAIISYSHALSCDDFGKSVFRTREEAEAALKEREI